MGTERRVSTSAAEIEAEEDGTIVIRVKAVDMNLARMREVLDARFSLGKRRAPVLIDTRRVLSMSREAQEASAAPEVRPYTDCMALLVENPVTVVLVNFFMVFVRPPYPTKMFRDEGLARSWLAQARSDRA